MMKIQRYDFTLIYMPGKNLVLADALSRATAGDSGSATDEDVQCHVNMVLSALFDRLPRQQRRMCSFSMS